jgi:hypothetical protein
MNEARAWIYRVLTLLVTGLLLITWFATPWWRAYITAIPDGYVEIRPWGLSTNLPNDYRQYLNPWQMPNWWEYFVWIFFGLLVAVIAFGLVISFLKRQKIIHFLGKDMPLQRFIMLGVGVAMTFVPIAMVVVAYIRTQDFGMSFLGRSAISAGGALESYVDANLMTGFWLICCVGPLYLVLMGFYNKILGKNKYIDKLT